MPDRMFLFFALGCAATEEAEPFSPGPGQLTEGTVRTCADPSLRETLGPLEETDLGPDWPLGQPVGWEGDYFDGEALAVEDFTGDGRLDVLVPDRTAIRYYASTPDGSWAEESEARLPPIAVSEGAAILIASPADIDGDGDLDLFVGHESESLIFRNLGDGTFEDVTEASGIGVVPWHVRGAPFADIDGDGDLDLFLANDRDDNLPPEPGQPNILYENQGDGTFRDVTAERLSAEDIDGYTKIGLFLDVDQDGAQDLYIINHLPEIEGNRMRFGLGDGTFESDTNAGLDVRMSGMGLGITDLNADGLPDLAVSGTGEIVLFLSVSERAWATASAAWGLLPQGDQVSAWGSDFSDLDNDTRSDLVVAFGTAGNGEVVGPNPEVQPDAFFHQGADGQFVDEAAAWGLDDGGEGRAVAAVDLDEDGWLDLLTHGRGEPARWFHARCGDDSWLEVRVRGAAPNTHAIGARVRVWAGDTVQTRWIQAGGALYTSTPAIAHFGLADAETVDRLTVDWPDGTHSEWRDLAARQLVTVTE